MNDLNTILLILLIASILLMFCMSKKEYYSGFRATGCIDKSRCIQYQLKYLENCMKRSGGVDPQGNCWAHVEPRLKACLYNDF